LPTENVPDQASRKRFLGLKSEDHASIADEASKLAGKHITKLSSIFQKLDRGIHQQKVGDEFGLTKDSVARHWNGHVTEKCKADLIGGPVAIRNLAKTPMPGTQQSAVIGF
jgi:hypothetical protein